MTTLSVKYDEQTDDFYLEFPEELMEQVGWKVGDTLKWTPNEDGSYTLTKKVDDIGTDIQTRDVTPDGTAT